LDRGCQCMYYAQRKEIKKQENIEIPNHIIQLGASMNRVQDLIVIDNFCLTKRLQDYKK